MLLCKSGDGLVFFHVSTIIEMMYACQPRNNRTVRTSRAIKRSGRSSQRCALARLANLLPARRGAMLMRQCRKRRDNLGFCSLNLWGLVKKLPLRKERNLRRASARVHNWRGSIRARADAQSARGVQKARFVLASAA
jgi:hypothetical protein